MDGGKDGSIVAIPVMIEWNNVSLSYLYIYRLRLNGRMGPLAIPASIECKELSLAIYIYQPGLNGRMGPLAMYIYQPGMEGGA